MAADRLGEGRIGEAEPAPRRDPVGLVVEALRKSFGEVAHRRLAQKFGMDRGYAVRAVGADDRQVRHANLLHLPFLDQARPSRAPGVAGEAGADVVEQPAVDLEDDLELARKRYSIHSTGQRSSASGSRVWLV